MAERSEDPNLLTREQRTSRTGKRRNFDFRRLARESATAVLELAETGSLRPVSKAALLELLEGLR